MTEIRLDLDYVRGQFPQLGDDPELVFCSNAGGSFVARQVQELLTHYNRHLRVQPYNAFSPSREGGEAMDRAWRCWAQALNVGEDELTFGPSTSANSYVLSQAMGAGWGPGDEIVLTAQDHEANHGVWRRAAEAAGARVREWPVEPDTGLLDPEALYPLLNERTRWVFFPHCSNIVGTSNPAAEIVAGIRKRCGARVGVDAVAYAPHHIPDLHALGVDLYLFSLYKVYGPHQGLMYLASELSEELPPQCHYFVSDEPHKRFNPAGPQHAQQAGCAGVIDYFRSLHEHHGGAPGTGTREMLDAVHALTAPHEAALTLPLIDYLDASGAVRLLGKPHCRDGDRMATIAFAPLARSAAAVAAELQGQGIGTEYGHFYAHRLITDLGIDPDQGVVRLSLLHYTSEAEVERIVCALDRVLAADGG